MGTDRSSDVQAASAQKLSRKLNTDTFTVQSGTLHLRILALSLPYSSQFPEFSPFATIGRDGFWLPKFATWSHCKTFSTGFMLRRHMLYHCGLKKSNLITPSHDLAATSYLSPSFSRLRGISSPASHCGCAPHALGFYFPDWFKFCIAPSPSIFQSRWAAPRSWMLIDSLQLCPSPWGGGIYNCPIAERRCLWDNPSKVLLHWSVLAMI